MTYLESLGQTCMSQMAVQTVQGYTAHLPLVPAPDLQLPVPLLHGHLAQTQHHCAARKGALRGAQPHCQGGQTPCQPHHPDWLADHEHVGSPDHSGEPDHLDSLDLA